MSERIGCGSSLCIFDPPKGMHTNGPCNCLEGLDKKKRREIEIWARQRKAERELMIAALGEKELKRLKGEI